MTLFTSDQRRRRLRHRIICALLIFLSVMAVVWLRVPTFVPAPAAGEYGDIIDIVLPWHDGSGNSSSSDGFVGSGAHREQGTLRYALRSYELHMPFMGRLHLIVHSERDVPTWLNRSAPRLHLVCRVVGGCIFSRLLCFV